MEASSKKVRFLIFTKGMMQEGFGAVLFFGGHRRLFPSQKSIRFPRYIGNTSRLYTECSQEELELLLHNSLLWTALRETPN